ncbi:MAG: DUF3891 family protein [Lacipirellulaceae bacterium]
MIVRNVEEGWEIIFQGSHGLLAGQFARRMIAAKEIKFPLETLSSIIEHDDLKEEFGDDTYVTDAGAPKDFTLFEFSANERYQESRRRIEHAYRKHRWMGLLISKHVEFLYEGEETAKRLTDLIEEEKQHREKVLKQLGIDCEVLDTAYELLRWCDRCSLILCRENLPAMERRLEIMTDRSDTRFEIWKCESDYVHVEPWPFDCEDFEVAVEVHSVKRLSYSSDKQLESDLAEGQTELRRWTFTNEGC